MPDYKNEPADIEKLLPWSEFIKEHCTGLIDVETNNTVGYSSLTICGDESTLADAIIDRISYDSYKINIESINPTIDLSMRDVYSLDPAQSK